MPALCNIPTHEYILRRSPAAAGQCAHPAHAADECIRRREGVTRRRCGLLPHYFGHLLLFYSFRLVNYEFLLIVNLLNKLK